jgi:hypothetical protein
MGANKMNMSVAFKCKLNDEQEFMLGQAMLRHESLIDRSYLTLADKRTGDWVTVKKPLKKSARRAMLRWFYDYTYGREFDLKTLLENNGRNCVYHMARKLVAAGAITEVSEHNGGAAGSKIYIVSDREVIGRMLADGN